MTRKGRWHVVERGVNGKPFLWKKPEASYVMIDVFKARPNGCYMVLALDANPLTRQDVKGKVIGIGCATAPTDWVGAYNKAREIADRYMSDH